LALHRGTRAHRSWKHRSRRELAAEELERAERIGVTRIIIRDLRVLGLAARGERGIELLERAVRIAESLFVSRKTVEYHLRHIYQKLEASSRPELAKILRRDSQP
jgi:DNA-binding CsgD family transcriptional regulator